MQVPMGFSIFCLVNGREYVVPMATEEPSVIAASCKAMKRINFEAGGFTCTTAQPSATANICEAQVYVRLAGSTYEAAEQLLLQHKDSLLQQGNAFCRSMAQRGGGLVDFRLKPLPQVGALVVHLLIDVCDSMGANCCNTVAEGFAGLLEADYGLACPFKIVSNYSRERLVRAAFRLPLRDAAAVEQASSIVALNTWAQLDASRAVTHNKGIFNGIDALALATGQDTRAIQAAGHLHASLPAGYGPLTQYEIVDDCLLVGSIELPLPVGIVGGTIKSNAAASANLAFLGIDSSLQLAFLMAAVGLAQNFSALAAIGGEGIQRGHMALHLPHILAFAGVPPEHQPAIAGAMQRARNYSQSFALQELASQLSLAASK